MPDRLPPKISNDLLYALAAVVLIYTLSRSNILDGYDFSLIWLAGTFWNAGGDPYAAGFIDQHHHIFGPGANDRIWVYPPYWQPIASLAAQVPFENAVLAWLGLNLACIVASAAVIARGARIDLSIALLLVVSLHATLVTLMLGQTSLIVLLGACFLLRGAEEPSSWIWSGIGLAILALKPQFGLAAGLYFLGKGNFRAVALGALPVAAAAIPLLAEYGLRDWAGFLHATAQYSRPDLTANRPPELNGATHLISLVVSTCNFGLAMMAVMAASAFAFGRARLALPETFCIAGLIAMILFLAPLHAYDTVAIAIPIAILANYGMRWPMLVCALLLIRPQPIAELTGFMNPGSRGIPYALLTTVVVAIVGMVWIYTAVRLPSFKSGKATNIR